MLIVLIGYRAVGKTTLGRRLAERLNLPFADSDDLICSQAGCGVAQIMLREGESGFRERERAVVRSVLQLGSGVISLGGGAVLDPSSRELLRTVGVKIWLRASAATIRERMLADAAAVRPALTALSLEDEIAVHLQQREPLYGLLADATVDTDRAPLAETLAALIDVVGQLRQAACGQRPRRSPRRRARPARRECDG